jgi:SPP1 gp7 family putative phage head morphogenesis protein
MDYGAKVADKTVIELEKKLRKIYGKAAKELKEKLVAFNGRFAKKQAQMTAKLEAEEITRAEYENWLRGQVFIGRQWVQKADQAARIMTKANEEAATLIRKGKLNVFAENYNYTAYQIDKTAGAFLNFNIYNEEAVEKLIRKKPKMLPEWKIDEPKDYRWNRQKVENAITQGIIQGKKVNEITDDLVSSLCTVNDNKMKTFARTAMTGAQNAGRIEVIKEANEDGIHTKKKWIATLDSRTRDAHQDLDGQTAEADEPFTAEFDDETVEIMFPGDPSCNEPGMVYNCRCTLGYVVEGYEGKGQRMAYDEWVDEDGKAHRESYTIDDMTYTEWKEWKQRHGK